MILNFSVLFTVSSDLYSTQINFTYNGEDSFKTLFGGVTSNIINLIILIIAILLSITILQRANTSTSTNKSFKDLTNDPTKHYFAKDNVFFAFALHGPFPDKILDPTYFSFKIQQVEYQKDSSPLGNMVSSTPIEYDYWRNNFPHVNRELYTKIGLSTYI